MKLAKRITGTSQKSFGMYEQAARLQGDTSDLIHLEVGRPDADTPTAIKQAAADALMRGEVHYSDLRGVPALREALAAKLRKQNKLDVGPDDVLVTNGLTHASFAAFFAILDEGDEVILLSPHYPQHIGKIELAGAHPVLVPLNKEQGFAIDAQAIEAAITPRTRMVVLVNPANPTGRVYRRSELEALAQLAIKHDLVVVSDEVYEDITYDDAEHISIASLPGMQERTVSMFAFTKSYAMDGWRIGYLAAPAWLMPGLLKITANDVTHVNTFIQAGALEAVVGQQEALRGMIADDDAKRRLMLQRLNAMANVSCAQVEGTIYAFADVRATGVPSQELAERLLKEARVVVEAGSFYGPQGEGFLRLCFGSASYEQIEQAMDRLQLFFAQLEAQTSQTAA
ncbi:pyridoxal phosphate-dependent aminotransferase [Alcaligenes nematophilus]|uniref:Pyridoxal phosphate-dependent aminotransferase n=1 Tax=Alcaligenes nematophilus TaxID=2994643 RepID=A0ABU3MWA3_9BURK|nr:pyridoxal phosphate-dependent aminotransferase [Alcaligenes nematophilus]MDT8465863.1 pyridoxal phosphate-dependent aminotransferase [Alcaligenes nematophilus]MDT8469096.1 pyridoxal phosphate-dependent aminotransferase [Alcaligenes nematophilus]MDT8505852.1 pyridoxal phosphate-dependent aminotransferase [Alcaligenes nematophilus]MDT8526534.1 pyridoxal phosphate-dependent aminotransferase [Alcaligenes nematophilus]